MMAVTVGRVEWEEPRHGLPWRVDRSSGSPLGNPFCLTRGLWGYEADAEREASVEAYRALLLETTKGHLWYLPATGWWEVPWRVAEVGFEHGFYGRVAGWNWEGARSELREILHVARYVDIELRCWCVPRKCHGHCIAGWVEGQRAHEALFPDELPSL